MLREDGMLLREDGMLLRRLTEFIGLVDFPVRFRRLSIFIVDLRKINQNKYIYLQRYPIRRVKIRSVG